jgi:hypothetical protein
MINGLLRIGAGSRLNNKARHARPLSRLRGRSRFGEAKTRASTSFFLAALQDVDGRDKPGHDGRRSFASLKRQLWQWRVAVPKLRKSLNFA